MMVGGAARVAVIEHGVPVRLLPAAVQDIADVLAIPHLVDAAGESFGGPAVCSAPVRRPPPQHLLRRQELPRACARVRAVRVRFERRFRRGAGDADQLLQGAGVRDRARRRDRLRSRGLGSHRLRRRAGGHHRQGRSRHSVCAGAGARLGLHHRQRCDRARRAGPAQHAILSFQNHFQGETALVFWLPSGQARIRVHTATDAVSWTCAAPHGTSQIDFGRILWGAAREYPQEILLREGGKPPGSFHLRIT